MFTAMVNEMIKQKAIIEELLNGCELAVERLEINNCEHEEDLFIRALENKVTLGKQFLNN